MNIVNNGQFKPKSRNENNNLAILKLKKESNTIDCSQSKKYFLFNQKIKSRNVNKEICKNQFLNNTFSSSFNNAYNLQNINIKQDMFITSSSNSDRVLNKVNMFNSLKKKLESALVSNKIEVNNIFSRNNPYNKHKQREERKNEEPGKIKIGKVQIAECYDKSERNSKSRNKVLSTRNREYKGLFHEKLFRLVQPDLMKEDIAAFINDKISPRNLNLINDKEKEKSQKKPHIQTRKLNTEDLKGPRLHSGRKN